MISTLHIELTNRCNLKCPTCPRTRFGINEIRDIQTSSYSNLQLDSFNRVLVVGCVGDALYYPHLREFFLYAKTINENIEIIFGTNGIGRDEKWWKKLKLYLPENHKVMFGIDGTDNETLNIYRVGSNYNKVIRNMRAFIDSGGKAEWQFILFRHNEHQLDKARELANEYGATFAMRGSYYYSDHNKAVLRPRSIKVITQMEQSIKKPEGKLICRIEDSKEIFVDCFGRILPCCLIGPNMVEANKITKGIIFNIHKYKIRDCLSPYYVNSLMKMINESKYCKYRCKVPFESIILERTLPNVKHQ
jgi:MoaA/NifB/PqqE/SkfB family radical SAM enzyme